MKRFGRTAPLGFRQRGWHHLAWLVLFLITSPVSVRGEVDFAREIRPILSKHCFKCHGPDDKAREGGLRLDVREGALKKSDSDEVAIVPGKPDHSALIKRIFSTDEAEVMPPPSAKSPLSADQKNVLKQWITEGASYKPHWAFIAPKQAPLPAVKQGDWVQTPIDAFILAKLEANGLKPSPQADRATLVRRVYLDLIGLPPTPEEADTFLNDKDPRAYEKLVDKLLGSPHYGERWARRWLDLARYADTNGYEKDRARSVWPYRDWVIKALNDDLPFDQFTIQQLAGDMLPNPTLDQQVATGFHRNTMLNEEGGIDPLEFRFYAMVDRINTTSTVWLGLTMGCAQCHTHKYDPITQREYYQMMSFLNNADEPRRDIPQPEIVQQRSDIELKIQARQTQLMGEFPVEKELSWEALRPSQVTDSTGQPRIEIQEDSSVLCLDGNPDKTEQTIRLESPAESVSFIKLEALTHHRLGGGGPGRRSDGEFVLSEIKVTVAPLNAPEQKQAVKLVAATAEKASKGQEAKLAIDGNPQTGWGITAADKGSGNHAAIFQLEKPVGFPQGTVWTIQLDQQAGAQKTLGRYRLSLGQVRAVATLAEKDQRREHLERKFQSWLAHESKHVVHWKPLKPVKATSNLPLLTIREDGTVFSTGDQTKRDVYEIALQGELQGATAIRLDVYPDDLLPEHGPGRIFYEGPFGDFHLSEFQAEQGGKALPFQKASQSFAANGATAAGAIDGNPQSGWEINGGQGQPHHAVFNFPAPLPTGNELLIRMIFEKYYSAGIGKFSFSASSDSHAAARERPRWVELVLEKPADKRTAEELNKLREYYVTIAPELESERQELDRLRRSIPAYPTALVMQERPAQNPRGTFIHKRGEFLQPTEQVQAATLSVLHPFPVKESHNRLEFARWLVSSQNPLVGRVTMNRHWGTIFGRGLVRTQEDFGTQGEAPTHPELLDWLAVEFMNRGWSIKKMHKLIVMSATYQQSSHATPELLAKDPQNRLYARGPRARLEAELIRDSALKISGLLSEKVGGPSVFPPQPPGVSTEGTYGALSWAVSTGSDRYRRGVYTFAKRTAPYAMFATFDAPSGEACFPRREVSNTPLQALTLLNDLVFTEAGQELGRQMTKAGGSWEEKIKRLFRRVLTRDPAPDEIASLKSFWDQQRARLERKELDAAKIAGTGEGDPMDRASWTLVSRTLLNLDETFTKE
ncbi:MAG: PSD1 and planctomycete cytochrome C domain-containing protein [Planctomycetales bacterium]